MGLGSNRGGIPSAAQERIGYGPEMGALWRVEILDRVGDRVRLALRMIHLDAGAFPLSKTFALRLLHERSIEGLDDHSVGPLCDAVTSRQTDDDDWMEQESPRHIADVAVTDVRGAPFDEQAMRREVAEQTRKAGTFQAATNGRRSTRASGPRGGPTPSARRRLSIRSASPIRAGLHTCPKARNGTQPRIAAEDHSGGIDVMPDHVTVPGRLLGELLDECRSW